jgi:membrane associated rhomboid family serine protease
MAAPKINKAKRFCFLFLTLAILSGLGFFALLSFGKANADQVTPEFFGRIGRVFGGLTGLFGALSAVMGLIWRSGNIAESA